MAPRSPEPEEYVSKKKRTRKALREEAEEEEEYVEVAEEEIEDVAKAKKKKKAKRKQEEEEWEEEEEEEYVEIEIATEKKKKKAKRKQAEEEGEEEGEQEEHVEMEMATGPDPQTQQEPEKPTNTRRRVTPEELEPGAVVVYGDGFRGVVHDAFEAIDNFWLADEETNELIKDEQGEIVVFTSEELQLVAPPPKLEQAKSGKPDVGVLVLGTSTQMVQVLEHFGEPDPEKRTEPQELLAIPCNLCDPRMLLQNARDGINPTTTKLAQEQRPDLHVALRVFHLKQAVEKCSSMLSLDKYFCLAGVTVPFSEAEIEESTNKEEKRWRKTVANQIDVGVTAYGRKESEVSEFLQTAQQVLGQSCGMCLSDKLWDKQVQTKIRENVGIPDLPLFFSDAAGVRIYVVVIPEDARLVNDDGIITCIERPGASYLPAKPVQEINPSTAEQKDDATKTQEEKEPEEAQPKGKTVAEWEKEQSQFADQPKLPPGWIRVTSKSTGQIYYFNKDTQETTFDAPLPEGWVQQVSKSTGKTYYFNVKTQKSTFVRPS